MSGDFYISIDGKRIKVSEDVYNAYMRPYWREKKRSAVRGAIEKSMDEYEGGFESFPSPDKLVDELVEDKILLELLLSALDELTESERTMIEDIFYRGLSEREISKNTGIPRKTIAYRKTKAIEKLKKIVKEE